jgi:hypothetical protein
MAASRSSLGCFCCCDRALDLDAGYKRRWGGEPPSAHGVGNFQLASARLPNLQVREAGEVDRGRWPAGLRFGAAVLSARAALLVTQTVVRRVDRPSTT